MMLPVPGDVFKVCDDSCPSLVLQVLIVHQMFTHAQLFLGDIMELLQHIQTVVTSTMVGTYASVHTFLLTSWETAISH